MFGKSKDRAGSRYARPARHPLRYGLAAIILLGVLAYHLVPAIVAPQSLAKTLTDGASEWFGAPATIGGGTSLTFWPRPKITITGFAVPRPYGKGPLIYGHAGTLTAHVGLFGALTGHPRFSDFALDDAVIIFETPDDSQGPPQGMIAKAIAALRSGATGTLTGEGPESLTLTNTSLGITRAGETTVTKGINGTLEWPELEGPARFSGNAVFSGYDTRISLRTGSAVALIAGRSSDISLNVTNDATQMTFNGTASGRQPYLINGDLALSTSHLQELMQWAGIESQLMKNVETASLQGKVTQSAGSLRFSPANLNIAKSKGNGVLDVLPAHDGEPVGISATMAFGDIALFNAKSSLPAWVDAVSEDSEEKAVGAEPLPKLDLRVSAKSVQLSDMTLKDVAASIIRSTQQTSFDIADSRLDDGSLYAHVGVESGGLANVEINAEHVRAGPLFRQLGFDVPLESDDLDFEMNVEALLPLSAISQNDVTGTIRFSAANGKLSWLAFGSLIEKARTQDAFTFSPLENSPRSFEHLSGAAKLSGSLLELQSVTMESGGDTITLDGTLDTLAGGLDATVTIISKSGNAPPVKLDIKGNALAAFARRVDADLTK